MKNPMGMNNFDKLEAAGLYAPADNTEGQKAKIEARVNDLGILISKVSKVEAFLSVLPTLEKPRQLKRLASAGKGLRELLATPLPQGTKKHIEACLNEVISLREGIFASNTSLDKTMLALTASSKARTELSALVESSRHRLEKIVADSSAESDMEDFYKNAGEVIKRTEHEAVKILPIKDKPFVLTRAPIVPMDGSISAEKLPQLGFKSESISGYPVIHNQLVLGINPKMMASHDPADNAKFAEMQKKLKDADLTIEQIKRQRGRIRDAQMDLSKVDKEKAKPDFLKQKEEAVRKAESDLKDMIDRAGIDPDEYIKLDQRVKRSHNAVPQAVKDEADRLRKLLERKKGVKLRFVSDSPRSHPGNPGIWFWLMPDKELDMLAKAAFGKRVNVSRWGFAFN
jgi:hypothetical protein